MSDWFRALNQVQFDTCVSDIYSFAYLTFQLATWLGDLEMGQNNQIFDFKEWH